jgi:hypothetical protein
MFTNIHALVHECIHTYMLKNRYIGLICYAQELRMYMPVLIPWLDITHQNMLARTHAHAHNMGYSIIVAEFARK